MMHEFGYRDLNWKGDELYYERRKLARIVQDKQYAWMWHVHMSDGRTCGPLNRSRAKDAAMKIAVAEGWRWRVGRMRGESPKPPVWYRDSRKDPPTHFIDKGDA